MRVSNTLAFAAGHWRIERVLDDHRSGTQGRFAGRAALTEPDLTGAAIPGTAPVPGTAPAPGTALQYLETGELRFGTHAGPATRALRYQGLPGRHGRSCGSPTATSSIVLTCALATAQRSTSAAPTATRSPTWCSATTRWKSAGGCAGRTRTTDATATLTRWDH